MTLQVQNVIIPAILGVMFGMLILLAILATSLVVFQHIRSGGFFLLLYFIWVGVILFLGPGRPQLLQRQHVLITHSAYLYTASAISGDKSKQGTEGDLTSVES